MKILAFTDIHESKSCFFKLNEKLRKHKVDLVICTGDFTIFGNSTKKVIEQISKLHDKVILLHGNHEDEDEIRSLCKNYKNITFLHKDSCDIGDFTFFGYGGGGFAVHDNEFIKSAVKFLEGFSKKKGKRLIFLTHGPAYGTKLDALWGDHVGNIDYKEFIDALKPSVYMCGHLHENFRVHYVEKGMLYINPGPEGMIIDIDVKAK